MQKPKVKVECLEVLLHAWTLPGPNFSPGIGYSDPLLVFRSASRQVSRRSALPRTGLDRCPQDHFQLSLIIIHCAHQRR